MPALQVTRGIGGFTGTECLDRTVTRQNVRPFLGHVHWRGETSPRGVPGGRQVRGKTRIVVDRSAGQTAPRHLAAPAHTKQSIAVRVRPPRNRWPGHSYYRNGG